MMADEMTGELADDLTERERIFRDDLQEVLRNSHSRRFIWWILQQCGIYDNEVEPEHAGRRGIGLTIIHAISRQNSNAYPTLMIEMGQFEEKLKEIERSRKAEDEN